MKRSKRRKKERRNPTSKIFSRSSKLAISNCGFANFLPCKSYSNNQTIFSRSLIALLCCQNPISSKARTNIFLSKLYERTENYGMRREENSNVKFVIGWERVGLVPRLTSENVVDKSKYTTHLGLVRVHRRRLNLPKNFRG